MRKMKDSGIEWIGEIPESWELRKGKFLFSQRNEKGNRITVQLLSPTQKYGVIPQSMYEELSGMKAVKLDENTDFNSMKSIYNGDFCISLRSFQGGFEYSEHNGVVSPAYQVFYKTADISNDYYRYMFKERGFIDKMSSLTKTFRDGKSISFSDFADSLIPLPPLPEQQKIASYLDTQCAHIDSVIEKTKQSIEEYKKLKQAVITQAVTKGVRGEREMKDSGVEWIGEIPKEWKVFRIAALYSERKEQGNDELPILTVSINTGVSDRELSDEESERVFVRSEDKSKYMRVYPGDLTYNMMRAWQGAFGAVRVDGMVSPAYVIVKPRREIDSRYMEALLRTDSAKEEMKRYSHGIADFRLRLYWDKFKAIKVCFPPIEEQKEISDYIDQKCADIDTLITKKEQFLTELESYKKSMIYEYVTGKKEVPQ